MSEHVTLRAPRELASTLRCSRRTLHEHIWLGASRYFVAGHGAKGPEPTLAGADLSDFVEGQTRREVCSGVVGNEKAAVGAAGTSSIRPEALLHAAIKHGFDRDKLWPWWDQHKAS